MLFTSSCSNKNSVIVEINVKSKKDSKVYFEKINFSDSKFIDSTDISKGDNNIRFKVKDLTEPSFFTIQIPDKGEITILCEANEKVNVIVDAEKINDYTVLGSKGSQFTKDLSLKLLASKTKLLDLKEQYNSTQDEIKKKMIEQEYYAVIDSQRAYNSKFIWANTMSRASVMALYQKFDDEMYVFDKSEDIILFKAVASSLKALYPNSEYTQGMLNDIKRMEGIVRNAKIQDMIKQSVASIPDISLSTPKGDVVKLSSLKGKVVLLNFWASYDQQSMLDIRELIETYNQFKGKGFEIYQVSLDTNRDDWLNAIESASLPGINVCGLNPKGSIEAGTYNVTQLPTNFLIDRNHTIVGKNLFGEELRKKLRDIL